MQDHNVTNSHMRSRTKTYAPGLQLWHREDASSRLFTIIIISRRGRGRRRRRGRRWRRHVMIGRWAGPFLAVLCCVRRFLVDRIVCARKDAYDE